MEDSEDRMIMFEPEEAGYILDAFDEGITLFDPEGFLEKKRAEL